MYIVHVFILDHENDKKPNILRKKTFRFKEFQGQIRRR